MRDSIYTTWPMRQITQTGGIKIEIRNHKHHALTAGSGTTHSGAHPGTAGDRRLYRHGPGLRRCAAVLLQLYEPATADLKARNQNVLHLVNYLESLLPKEAHRKVEEYIDAVNNRYTAELDYAYMVGFQTAFRMMLLGITDPELIMSKIQPTADS